MEALAKSSMVIFMLMAFAGACFGAVYKVGDSHGWTNKGHVNYKHWSHSKHFVVGDSLVFEYKNDNVVQVEPKYFKECKAKDARFTLTSGNDTIQLTTPGDFYYISGLHGHCHAGQKLHIKVYPSSSSRSTSSSSPSSSSPSPSPSSPSPSSLTPSPTPSSPSPSSSTPSLSPSFQGPSQHPYSPSHSPSGSPSHGPSLTPSQSPSPSAKSPPNPSPISRPNPPPPRTPNRNPFPPIRPVIVHWKSQAAPTQSSNGVPVMQILMAVAVLAYIA